ncbi:DUF397 domain-containing protein [Streptomyces cellulosae]|uniref:DUF397 domain-containing protein n=1 Tax=Streptomyces cellulosae TaxID=1968 RepID=UPI0004C895A4|nr:DUF397 domain-containing protein [Streptomyces cellulosae]
MTAYAWQKSSYCAQGESCLHVATTALSSPYRQEGNASVPISAPTRTTVHLTESADPAQAILTTDAVAFGALLDVLKASESA